MLLTLSSLNIINPFPTTTRLNGTSVASSSSGPVTPSTAGPDSILNFSLPVSGKSGSQDDVFNPDGTGLKSPDRPAQQLPEEDPAAEREKTGLEDSFYEDCGLQPARYIPGERYVDIKHNTDSIFEGQSQILTDESENF